MEKNKIVKFIRRNILTIGLTIVYLLFHTFFENFISKLLVTPFLTKVNSGLLNDLIFAVILLVIGGDFYQKFQKNYKVTIKTLLQFSIGLSIYLFYRVCGDLWDFSGFSFLKAIKYLDVLALYLLGNILLFVVYKTKKDNSAANKGFYLDTSLGKSKPDLLNRESLAKYICSEIEETDSPDSSFAIGISSEWGFGKTSFFDLLERHLKLDANIIIKINPWINHESKSIVMDFFNALSSKLSEYNSDISPLIKKYAELLVGLGNSNLDKFLNPTLTHYSQNSTTLSEFELIDTVIKNLDKKLIIFIDDLDRLYKEEIIQVVKLIRNSANFGNTVFIVAYDRNYVTNAIKEINNYNPEFFLEKIFQLEIRLPNFEDHIIQKRIYDLLSSRVTESDKTELLDILLNKRSSFETNVFNSGTLTTLRDATRFSNSFLVAYSYLKGEIVLSDLLNLEVLRLKYPGVYKLIFFHSEEFLETSSDSFNKTHYSLRLKKNKDSVEKETISIKQYLNSNYDKIGIPKSEIDKAINLLYTLFPSSDNIFYSRDINLLSVSNPSSFERYSHYRLLDTNISEIEFSQFRMKSIKEFCIKIKEWVEKGLRWELKRRFESIKAFSDKEDFEKIIQAIFYFARVPKVESIENDYSGFDYDNLYNKLNQSSFYIKLGYYKTEEEYRKFITDMFKDAPSPYAFDIEFIYSTFDKFTISYNFIVPKEDFEKIRLDYLKKYLQETSKFDSNVWHLFQYSDDIVAVEQGGNSYQIHKSKNKEAIKLVIDFIKNKALDDFLFDIIKKEHFNKELYVLGEIIPKMFGSFKDFESFLTKFKTEDYLYLKEFLDFFKKLEEYNFSKYIKFDFTVIPIKKRTW